MVKLCKIWWGRKTIVQKLQHYLISKSLNIIAHEIYTLTYIVSYYVHEGWVCLQIKFGLTFQNSSWLSSSYSNKSLAMNMSFIMGMHVLYHHHHHPIILTTIHFLIQSYFAHFVILNEKEGPFFLHPHCLHKVFLDRHQGLFCGKLWNNKILKEFLKMPFGKKMEVTSFGGTLLPQYAKEVACQVSHQTLRQLPSKCFKWFWLSLL